jgi:hypothetical protein
LGTLQSPDACRQAPQVSTRAQDAIPDPLRTQVVTEYLFQDFPRLFQVRLVFPLRFLVSETSHTSVYYFVYPVCPIRTFVSHSHPLELGLIQPRKRRGTVTSQHVLYYCTHYSVSFACTVHCTYYIYCTLYIQYIFPVSLFPMLKFHLQHLFTLISSLVLSLITYVHITLILTKLLPSA